MCRGEGRRVRRGLLLGSQKPYHAGCWKFVLQCIPGIVGELTVKKPQWKVLPSKSGPAQNTSGDPKTFRCVVSFSRSTGFLLDIFGDSAIGLSALLMRLSSQFQSCN